MKIEIQDSRWPELEILLAGYLNQDWKLDYPSVWAAVEAFRSQSQPRDVAAAVAAIGTLVVASDGESAIRMVCEEVGCGYYPPGDGLTYLEWFTQVRDSLVGSPNAG
jgi:hypothetical protein